VAGRLAIDFGTSNTRAALWDAGSKQPRILAIPEISELRSYTLDGVAATFAAVPSLVAYQESDIWIGKQVRDRALGEQPCTFRWMKRYIAARLKLPRKLEGREIDFEQAGADFLGRVLDYASLAAGLDPDEEVAFTAPVEAYEDYQDWLLKVSERIGLRRYRLLDEASAAALGYGAGLQPGHVCMAFDFGGGTLDVSVVRIEEEPQGGRYARVLGKAGAEIGGATIDQWLYQDTLAAWRKAPEEVRHFPGLLGEIERVKEELTGNDQASILVTDPRTGAVLSRDYTRTRFEDLLEAKGLFSAVERVVSKAVAEAAERGYDRDRIQAVFLVGGSSLIPSVRRALRQMFGERVRYQRPLEAVALGGAAFAGGVSPIDRIQHNYALRFFDREMGGFVYRLLVEAGAPYPVEELCTQSVGPLTDQADQLGLDIYEIGYSLPGAGPPAGLELVWDHNGAARLCDPRQPPGEGNYWRYLKTDSRGRSATFFAETRPPDSPAYTRQEQVRLSSAFWMNERNRKFIRAEPKARKGEIRFGCRFSIDGNKRLCVTVRDNLTGQLVKRDEAVIRLT